jgi:predicted transglutaminase-like cysteine proteinase
MIGRRALLGAALAIAYFGTAKAQPVDLTADQIKLIERTNIHVNRALPRKRPDGTGNCVEITALKWVVLEQQGIPKRAIAAVSMPTPRNGRWSGERHVMLRITATYKGEPWVRFLDMNSPWLLTAKEVRAWGFPYPEDVP